MLAPSPTLDVLIDYTNFRGERAIRRIKPLSIRFGANEWYTDPQYLLRVYDYGRADWREFATKDIHSWKVLDE